MKKNKIFQHSQKISKKFLVNSNEDTFESMEKINFSTKGKNPLRILVNSNEDTFESMQYLDKKGEEVI